MCPLDDDFDRKIQDAIPDKTQLVIVYCQDLQCPASSKAARRMEELGYNAGLQLCLWQGGLESRRPDGGCRLTSRRANARVVAAP
jgi:hypothetical protein